MNFLKKMSLKNRIILLSITLTLLVSSITSVSYYQNISRDLETNLRNHSVSMSFQVSKYFDERLRSIITRVYTLVSSTSYTTALQNYLLGNEEYQYPLALTRLNGMFSEIKMSDPFINSVYINTPKGNFFDLSSYPMIGFNFRESRLYQDYLNAGSPSLYTGYQTTDEIFKGGRKVIPMVVKMSIPGYLSGDIFLIINIDSIEMDNYLSKSTVGKEGAVVIDSEKRLIATNYPMANTYVDLLDMEDGIVTWPRAQESYVAASAKLDTNNWTVVVFSDKHQIDAALGASRNLLLILILCSALLAGAISLFFATRIVRPLGQLQSCMMAVTQGDYTRRYIYSYGNEVGRLAKCYNYMAEKIGNLIAELNSTIDQLKIEKENVRLEQTAKRQAELNALQAQIDPHFLHNTLNSIIWLAAEEDNEGVSNLAAELANFYEYRIRGGRTIIRLRDEIEQVKSYLAIQKVRYGNTIAYRFELDESLMDSLILKLALQPLVENAIFHGVQSTERAVKQIALLVREADDGSGDIEIEVQDNGAGIPSEKLETMNRQLHEMSGIPTDGYGIYNVNERIKLYFGEEYGLRYDSEPSLGTRAIIRIPQKDSAEDDG